MYVKKNYGFWMTFNWSKWPFIWGTFYSGVIFCVHYIFDLDFSIAWQPIGVIGIAVAFYLGFKNNSSYDRTWEARKIWGSIVNNSRTFGAAVVAFVNGDNVDSIRRELVFRHIAWLTALRYQLRVTREWEHTQERVKGLYAPEVCEDYYERLDHEMVNLISDEEFEAYKTKANIATQILKTQSVRLQELRDQGYFEDFRHMEFHQLITSFYADQGKSERIKNFPFPRQYASVALWMTVVYSAIIPFGLLDIFHSKHEWMEWLFPFISGLIIWIFFLMEKIGDYSENPFEGTYNDVPITSIAVGIEIDLRQMIDDSELPDPIKPVNGFLM